MIPYEFLGGKFRITLNDECWVIEKHETRKGEAVWRPQGYYTQLHQLQQPILRLIAARSQSALPEAIAEGVRASDRLQRALREATGGK